MKKIGKILLVCILMLSVTGCQMIQETEFVIKKDKSVDITVKAGVDEEALKAMFCASNGFEAGFEEDDDLVDDFEIMDSSNEEIPDDSFDDCVLPPENEIKEKLMEGLEIDNEDFYDKVEYTHTDDFYGYLLTRHVESIDKITGELQKTKFDLSELGKEQKGKIFNVLNDIYSLNVIYGTEENEDSLEVDGMEDVYKIELKITLPNKANSHNAKKVSDDELTYTWNLMEEKTPQLAFEFKNVKKQIFGMDAMIFYLICGAVVLILLIIILSIISRMKSSDEAKKQVKPQVNPFNEQVVNTMNSFNPSAIDQVSGGGHTGYIENVVEDNGGSINLAALGGTPQPENVSTPEPMAQPMSQPMAQPMNETVQPTAAPMNQPMESPVEHKNTFIMDNIPMDDIPTESIPVEQSAPVVDEAIPEPTTEVIGDTQVSSINDDLTGIAFGAAPIEENKEQ